MNHEDIIPLLDKIKYQRDITENRYLNPHEVYKELAKLSDVFKQEEIGKSVKGNSIRKIIWGKGSTRVMMWSQMHGNESTTTRALINLLLLFNDNPSHFKHLYENLQLIIIPIVNPDGAISYERFNANQVDLNRDAVNLSQPESKLLMQCFRFHQPDFCLNLHDQRCIFGTNNDFAGISFLAPSYNNDQLVNSDREKSMSLIAKTANFLSRNGLDGNIGRYDETYNKNCFGDFFQNQGTPTVLVEAGQLQLDYNRNLSAYHSMISLLTLLDSISYEDFTNSHVNEYYDIPMNEKIFSDLLIKNVRIGNKYYHLELIYEIKVTKGKLMFFPKIKAISNKLKASHRIIDADGNYLTDETGNKIRHLSVGEYLSSLRVNSVNFSLF